MGIKVKIGVTLGWLEGSTGGLVEDWKHSVSSPECYGHTEKFIGLSPCNTCVYFSVWVLYSIKFWNDM
jgi:hypothetical protein